MRQVFASQRVETVEGVAELLREAGIEVRISNGRSYHSKRRGQFSYLAKADEKTMPAVWVVHAVDQPRARQLLREAGLMETTRPGEDGTPATPRFRSQASEDAMQMRQKLAWRIRLVLLLLIAGVVLFVVLHYRRLPAPPAPAVPAQPQEEEIRIRIPSNPPSSSPAPSPPG